MRILICGSRNWTERKTIRDFMDTLAPDTVIITGGAKGADYMASEYATKLGLTQEVYPADWDTHGKAAGPIRNQQMLDEGKPDLVVAFHKNGSTGTADMVRRAETAGVFVKKFLGNGIQTTMVLLKP